MDFVSASSSQCDYPLSRDVAGPLARTCASRGLGPKPRSGGVEVKPPTSRVQGLQAPVGVEHSSVYCKSFKSGVSVPDSSHRQTGFQKTSEQDEPDRIGRDAARARCIAQCGKTEFCGHRVISRAHCGVVFTEFSPSRVPSRV